MNAEPVGIPAAADSDDTFPWINPVGGLGDILMLSSMLKLCLDRDPNARFNCARRTRYQSILRGHPAIREIGHPHDQVKCLRNDYWSLEELGPGNQRAFQVLARAFGLLTPVPEILYMPDVPDDDPVLWNVVPWSKKMAVIAPFSDSPRKVMPPLHWHELVERLTKEGVKVLQVGKAGDLHIKGAFSLLGATTPRQVVALLKRCGIAVTADNFIMHAARCALIPAVVVWGPTDKLVYGYDSHTHFQGPSAACPQKDTCIGPRVPQNYSTFCPFQHDHCMNKFKINDLVEAILYTLKK